MAGLALFQVVVAALFFALSSETGNASTGLTGAVTADRKSLLIVWAVGTLGLGFALYTLRRR